MFLLSTVFGLSVPVCLSVCLSARPFFCLFVCLFNCVYVHVLCVHMYACEYISRHVQNYLYFSLIPPSLFITAVVCWLSLAVTYFRTWFRCNRNSPVFQESRAYSGVHGLVVARCQPLWNCLLGCSSCFTHSYFLNTYFLIGCPHPFRDLVGARYTTSPSLLLHATAYTAVLWFAALQKLYCYYSTSLSCHMSRYRHACLHACSRAHAGNALSHTYILLVHMR